MDKKRFEELEKECKDAWSELAKTGSSRKPEFLRKYVNWCPACYITSLRENYYQECALCPIDIWRWRCSAACEGLDDEELYGRWNNSLDPDERRGLAAEIAALKWTYLPEYEKFEE